MVVFANAAPHLKYIDVYGSSNIVSIPVSLWVSSFEYLTEGVGAVLGITGRLKNLILSRDILWFKPVTSIINAPFQ